MYVWGDVYVHVCLQVLFVNTQRSEEKVGHLFWHSGYSFKTRSLSNPGDRLAVSKTRDHLVFTLSCAGVTEMCMVMANILI